MDFLEKRAFAGQIARAGESQIIAKSSFNRSESDIGFGVFVGIKDDGVTTLSKATDTIAGVTLKIGTKSVNKPDEALSVLSLPHGAEIWVQGKSEHGLSENDDVKIEATAGEDAGKVAKTPTLSLKAAEGKFYAVEILGDLIKIARKEA